MAAKKALTLTLHIDGIRETLAAFRDLPKEAGDELRERTQALSQTIAESAQRAGRAESKRAALVATTVKARRDRAPSIVVGGAKRLGRQRTPAWALLFTSEFGSNRRTGWYAARRFQSSAGRQFKPHRGQASYWFFASVEREQSEIARAWNDIADDIVSRFSEGGG